MYEAFKPEIVVNQLMTDRDRLCVFKPLTYKGPMIGEIKNKGSKLILPAIGRPTVRALVNGVDITTEVKNSTKQEIEITEAKYVAFKIYDTDNAQAADRKSVV